jgi:hypothetical protein
MSSLTDRSRSRAIALHSDTVVRSPKWLCPRAIALHSDTVVRSPKWEVSSQNPGTACLLPARLPMRRPLRGLFRRAGVALLGGVVRLGSPIQQHPPTMIVGPIVTMNWPPM